MGSNVSRHSSKGLTGRRSQSSGNLYQSTKLITGTAPTFPFGRSGGDGSGRHNVLDENYKLSGSLPNHLDAERPDVVISGNRNREKYEHTWSVHDQGYASERSPEEERIPNFAPAFINTAESPTPALWKARLDHLVRDYPFVTPATTFEVRLVKGHKGFGFSVAGGSETSEPWAGLVRIKRLFPHQPAWQTGLLAHGDILLAANEQPLVGLTNMQALQVLRQTSDHVVLTVCRAPEHLGVISQDDVPSLPPPPPPRRTPISSVKSTSPPPLRLHHMQPQESLWDTQPLQSVPPTYLPVGEVNVVLKKINHSLGFTLRKEDGSVLGHYIRALVREPALSDGRVHPGDKIVQVNGVDISPLTHEEAVNFLRHCGDIVHLRLYRDGTQTPISSISPNKEQSSSTIRPKPILRKEAIDMLSDLAVRKLSTSESNNSSRRTRFNRLPDPTRNDLYKSNHSHQEMSQSLSNCKYIVETLTPENDSFESFNKDDETIQTIKPERPNFLDLNAKMSTGSTSGITRKQRFALNLPSQLETVTYTTTTSDDENYVFVVVLNNPSANSQDDETGCTSLENNLSQTPSSSDVVTDNGTAEPSSLPPVTYLSSTSSTSTAFSYRNPAYQSAHPTCGQFTDSNSTLNTDGTKGLLKWKGVMFPDAPASSPASASEMARTPTYDQYKIIVVELCKGWNSRLGFSLKGEGNYTYISAIYPDSVASKDGRLQVGDRLIKVNDEDVQQMTTPDIIDLLRRIRGMIAIKIIRRCGLTFNQFTSQND